MRENPESKHLEMRYSLDQSKLWNTQINPFSPLKYASSVQINTPSWFGVSPAVATEQAEEFAQADITKRRQSDGPPFAKYILPHIPASLAVQVGGSTAKHVSKNLNSQNSTFILSPLDKVAKHAFELGTRTVISRRQEDGVIPRSLDDDWKYIQAATKRMNSVPQSHFRSESRNFENTDENSDEVLPAFPAPINIQGSS